MFFRRVNGAADRHGEGARLSLRARTSERGATAVEYALMVGLIAVAIVAAVTAFGLSVNALFLIPAGVFGGP